MAQDQNGLFVMTQEGFKKLEEELDYLLKTKRAEVAEKIRVARGFGDLSENAEYEEAKNEQAFMEGRILELDNMLRHAQIVDSSELDKDEVGLGSTVRVLDVEFNEEDEYTITGSTEADITQNRISNESPMGAALLGAHVGDTVEVAAPDGMIKMKILSVRSN
ncbi:MAG TPA: transcription elongation factor GreA [Candidatus Fimadaptatus faecigallinarum]|uniref:Transcription elongation factor GreA n=1 Tax=Candidatus Fimadaptatus faecigallinarum TaxID=2840814 RepID=A0A9D1S3V2_9FIRM|nr:transcription elongation factor GreA [Candidatus Fimadaptatus faecigallinarum]